MAPEFFGVSVPTSGPRNRSSFRLRLSCPASVSDEMIFGPRFGSFLSTFGPKTSTYLILSTMFHEIRVGLFRLVLPVQHN